MAVAFVPRGSPVDEDAVSDESIAALEIRDSQGSADGWYDDPYTLTREADGHFYADVALSGMRTRMLVDTGASVIALTAEDAAAAGVIWNPADIAPIGHGASGVVEGVNVVLPEVELGGVTQRDVRAVVIPEGLAISLLGQSFLSNLGSVNIANDRMVLGPQ